MHKFTRKTDMNITRLLFDTALIVLGFPIAIMFAGNMHAELDWQVFLWMPLLYLIVFLFTMSNRGLYEYATFTYRDRAMRGVTASALGASVVCTVFLFFMPPSRASTDFLALYSLNLMLLLNVRYALSFGFVMHKGHLSSAHVLYIGQPRQIEAYMFFLAKTSFQTVPIGFLSESEEDYAGNLKRLGSVSDLNEVLSKNVVDEVVLAFRQEELSRATPLLETCNRKGLIVKIALNAWDTNETRCYLHSVGPMPVLVYQRANFTSVALSFKRVLDVVFGFLGLVLCGVLSVFIVPMLWASGTEVISKQPRQGLNGRHFVLYQFRISRGNGVEIIRKVEDMTPVGRLLFHTKLYMLPTFLNVLRGEMSLVGTKGVSWMDGAYCDIHEADPVSHMPFRPGMTGLWSLKSLNRQLDDNDILELDKTYVENWSMRMDAKILLLTPFAHLVNRFVGRMFRSNTND